VPDSSLVESTAPRHARLAIESFLGIADYTLSEIAEEETRWLLDTPPGDDLDDQLDEHVYIRFVKVVEEAFGVDPGAAWIYWWQDRRDLGDHRPQWSLAQEIRDSDPALFASFLAMRGRMLRDFGERKRNLWRRQLGRIGPPPCSGRHRRAPGRRPIRRRGSWRSGSGSRASPDDPHELPDHLAAPPRQIRKEAGQ
jgi:hypothetical protein